MKAKDETVPCLFCGKPTPMLGTRKCTNCWEVTLRLPEFLRTAQGRKFCQEELARLGMPVGEGGESGSE